MKVGTLLRVKGLTGMDSFYEVEEVQMGDIGKESVVLIRPLTKGQSQHTGQNTYWVPLSLAEQCHSRYEKAQQL